VHSCWLARLLLLLLLLADGGFLGITRNKFHRLMEYGTSMPAAP
jgi:hypothetical protein